MLSAISSRKMEAHDLELVRGHKSRLYRQHPSSFIRDTKERLKCGLMPMASRARSGETFRELLSSDCSQNTLLSNKVENGYELGFCSWPSRICV